MDFQIDPLRLWNASLSVLAEGIALPGRGRAILTTPLQPEAAVGPVFRLETASGSIFAELRHLPLGAITQSSLDMAALSRLPPALAEAILTTALGLMLQQAGHIARSRVLAITPSTPALMTGDEHLVLHLEGIWPDAAEVALQSDRAVLAPLLLDLMPVTAKGRLPDAVARQITLPCSLRLAGRDLPLARLRALGPGDILLLSSAAQVLNAPHAAFHLLHDGSNWTIGSLAMNDDLPPSELPAPMADIPATSIGDVPIRLSFVLADRSLTLAEVQGLAPGAYLPLDPAPATPGQPVRILANGRQIGDGNIVEVDGQQAVRIARLFGG